MISLAVFHLLRTKVPTLPRQLLRCIEFHKIPQIIVISLFETFLLTWKLWCWKKWHLQNKILTKSFQNVSFLVCFIPQRIITHSMKNRRKIIKVQKVLCFFVRIFFGFIFDFSFFSVLFVLVDNILFVLLILQMVLSSVIWRFFISYRRMIFKKPFWWGFNSNPDCCEVIIIFNGQFLIFFGLLIAVEVSGLSELLLRLIACEIESLRAQGWSVLEVFVKYHNYTFMS